MKLSKALTEKKRHLQTNCNGPSINISLLKYFKISDKSDGKMHLPMAFIAFDELQSFRLSKHLLGKSSQFVDLSQKARTKSNRREFCASRGNTSQLLRLPITKTHQALEVVKAGVREHPFAALKNSHNICHSRL